MHSFDVKWTNSNLEIHTSLSENMRLYNKYFRGINMVPNLYQIYQDKYLNDNVFDLKGHTFWIEVQIVYISLMFSIKSFNNGQGYWKRQYHALKTKTI